MILTILTPTFNRGILLEKLYESLGQQKNFDFQWLIIDDGSTDNTREIVNGFKNNLFRIDYYYKENGGKCSALNFSHKYIIGEWVFVVDSDDTLTNDAVKTILEYIEKYKNKTNVGAFSFERVNSDKHSLSKNIHQEDYISNVIDYRINQGIGGDQAEVYQAVIFKMFSYPVYENENFLGEDYLHIMAADVCDTVYVDKYIYICDYLADGLTRAGRSLRLRNPLGGMFRNSLYFSKRFKIKYRIKGMMLYICYALCANKSLRKLYCKNEYKLLFIGCLVPGICLYFYWKFKYL